MACFLTKCHQHTYHELPKDKINDRLISNHKGRKYRKSLLYIFYSNFSFAFVFAFLAFILDPLSSSMLMLLERGNRVSLVIYCNYHCLAFIWLVILLYFRHYSYLFFILFLLAFMFFASF
jgi:hypothetical protein